MKKILSFPNDASFYEHVDSLSAPWVSRTKLEGNIYYSCQPSAYATLLYGSKRSSAHPYIDLTEYYVFDTTVEIDNVTYYRWVKQNDEDSYYFLTETRNFLNVDFDNPYHVTAYYYPNGDVAYDDCTDYVIYYGGNTAPTKIIDIPYHDTSVLNANGVSYVDLGLPSGALWAAYNVGAEHSTTPDSWYGNYFQWGDTEPANNKTCDWEHYKYCNGTDNTLTKYCPTEQSDYWDGEGNPDNKLVLDESDDMAKILGGDWHMPSQKLVAELVLCTTSEWVEDYNGIKGLNGRLFTSNINGNTLFIPAAGFRNGDDVDGVGDYVYLWSTALSLDDPSYACSLYANSGSAYLSSGERCCGFSVRGVLY